jgi:sulfur relay protein TusB/DsrH
MIRFKGGEEPMATRKLLYHFNRPPHGTVFNTEGMRASVGAVAGVDEHEVTILFQKDGVYYSLKDVDRSENMGYEVTLKKFEVKSYVVNEDLKARGISEEEIADDMTVISREDAFKLYQEAEFILDW